MANEEKGFQKANINWARWIYGKTRENVEKSIFYESRLLHI